MIDPTGMPEGTSGDSEDPLGEPDLAIMKTAFHEGSLRASEALASWIGKPSIIEIDSLERLPLEEATGLLARDEEPICFCSMEFSGPISGEMILAFDDASGWALTDILLGQPTGTATDWGEMETSAVMETTNILCCAYLNALAPRLTGLSAPESLVPMPPKFARDFAESLMQFALMGQAISFEQVILARTRFEVDATPVSWTLLFVPDAESMLRLSQWLSGSDDDAKGG